MIDVQTTALKPFEFRSETQSLAITPLMVNNDPYFFGKEICKALALQDTGRALQNLDADEKMLAPRKLFGLGFGADIWLINESGLYNLIFRSNKPEARIFRKWITGVVLPAIRKNGSYSLQPALPSVPDFSMLNRIPKVVINGKVLYSHQKLLLRINPSVKTGRTISKKHKKECFLIRYPGMKATKAYFITRSLAEEIITRKQKEVQYGTL